LIVVLVFFVLSVSPPANAIPAFARKCRLRCSARHESWPMLNYFGQKFKDNGYQLMNEWDAPIWQNPGYWPVTFRITTEPAVIIESIANSKAMFTKKECRNCHGPLGRGDGPSAATLTERKDQPIRPYDFSSGKADFRFKCGSTNADLYRIFMTGLDATPVPSFADVVPPNDGWDLVHFLRSLQVNHHSKQDDAVKAARGKIPAYVEKSAALVSQPEARVSRGDN
jgi:mono/diheme cytochrome c family protein